MDVFVFTEAKVTRVPLSSTKVGEPELSSKTELENTDPISEPAWFRELFVEAAA